MARIFRAQGRHALPLGALLLCAAALSGCPVLESLIVLDPLDTLGVNADTISVRPPPHTPDVSTGTGGASPGRSPRTPHIDVGDAVAGSAHGGFLREVLRISYGDDATELTTAPVAISQVVDSGAFSKRIEFTTVDLQDAGLLPPDGTLNVIPLDGIPLCREHGLIVDIPEGGLSFTPELYIGTSYTDGRLVAFQSYVRGALQLSLDLRVAVDEESPAVFEKDLFPPLRKPFTTYIGDLPVFGVAELRFVAGMQAYFDGDTHFTTGFTVNAPLEYEVVQEFGLYNRYTQFGPVDFSGHAPEWNFEVGSDIYFYLSVIAGISLYGAADFEFQATPYLQTNTHVTPPPQSFSLSAGLDIDTYCGLHLFDYRLHDRTRSYRLGPRELYYWSSTGD